MAATSTLEAVLQSGLAADRPLATAVGSGTLYVSTDTGLIEQSDGSSWNTWLDLSGVVGGSFQPLDSDLTAIAALSTASYGRNLLTLANVAALYTALSVDTDGTLAADSDTKIPSQKAVKTYADALLGAAHALEYKGATDCSANPNYPAGAVGDLYMVSVSGKIGGASGVSVSAGDLFVCVTANAGGTQASVGADWDVIHATATGSVTGPGSATGDDFATFNGTSGAIIKDSGLALDTDGTLAADSDAKLPSQKAVKTYVDTQVAGAGPGDTLHTIASSGATPSLDYGNGDVQDVTLTAACTPTFTGFNNGDPDFLTVVFHQDGTGGRTLDLSAVDVWPGSGVAPVMPSAAGATMTVVFWSFDGGTTLYGSAQNSASGLAAGTSFPGSPSDGDLFYRTDRNILYFYKSAVTKWLSVDRKYVAFGEPEVLMNVTTSGTLVVGRFPMFEDIYVEDFKATTFISTTNNGSNFWTVSLLERDSALSSTTLATFNTSGDTHDVATKHTVSVNAVVSASSVYWIDLATAKTGTPNTVRLAGVMVCRSVG